LGGGSAGSAGSGNGGLASDDLDAATPHGAAATASHVGFTTPEPGDSVPGFNMQPCCETGRSKRQILSNRWARVLLSHLAIANSLAQLN
jgi:hypothetical protein